MPLTTRPSLTSRQGMIRLASMRDLGGLFDREALVVESAPDDDRHRRCRDDLRDQLALLRRAGERAVEIDDVQAIRSASRHVGDELERALAEHGHAIAATRFESHDAATDEVHRGVELHACTN